MYKAICPKQYKALKIIQSPIYQPEGPIIPHEGFKQDSAYFFQLSIYLHTNESQ